MVLPDAFPAGSRIGAGTDGRESAVWKTAQGRFLRVRPCEGRFAWALEVLEGREVILEARAAPELLGRMVEDWLDRN